MRSPSGHDTAPVRSILGAGMVVAILVTTLHPDFGHAESFPAPSAATLAGLSVPQRIVVIAKSQVGYSTDPSSSYCNRYSAHWGAGTAGCPSGETAEEWCADFAAWVWQNAGVDINLWVSPGRDQRRRCRLLSVGGRQGPVAPCDEPIRCLARRRGGRRSLARGGPVGRGRGDRHGRRPDQPGPDVVSGDGDRTGFSVVETGTDQVQVYAGNGASTLAGYVARPRPCLGTSSGDDLKRCVSERGVWSCA